MKIYVHSEAVNNIVDHTFIWKSNLKDECTVPAILQSFRRNYCKKHGIVLDSLDLHLKDSSGAMISPGICISENYDDGCDLYVSVVAGVQQTELDDGEKTETPEILRSASSSETSTKTATDFLGALAIAKTHFLNGNFRGAREIWSTVLATDDSCSEAWAGIGEMNMALYKFQEAEHAFTQALASETSDKIRFLVKLGRAKMNLGRNEALEIFSEAKQLCNEMQASTISDVETAIGDYWFLNGDLDEALKNYQEVLKRENDKHTEALLGYSNVMLARSPPLTEQAISFLLKAIFIDQNHPSLKKLIGEMIVTSQETVEKYKQQLPLSEQWAPVYGYLASLASENGSLTCFIELQTIAFENSPIHFRSSFATTLFRGYQSANKSQEAFDFAKKFLQDNPQMKVAQSSFCNYDILQFLLPMSLVSQAIPETPERRIFWASSSSDKGYAFTPLITESNENSMRFMHTSSQQNVVYDDHSLSLLAFYFLLVKLLFENGALAVIPSLVHLIEQVRVPCAASLPFSAIQNEHAMYYFNVLLLASREGDLQSPLSLLSTHEPIYVCGDSNSLSTAWQVLNTKDRSFLLIPKHVAGMKHWHLRNESKFYTKENFWRVIRSIPKHSRVIFLFGDVDCRGAGMLRAVAKCKYSTIEDAMHYAADVYFKTLTDLVNEFGFSIFVHPIPPGLKAIRHLVKQYNVILKQKIQSYVHLKWLNFFDFYIDSENDTQILEAIDQEYQLEGAHLHPKYLKMLEESAVNDDVFTM